MISQNTQREIKGTEQLLADVFYSEKLPERELMGCLRRREECIPGLMKALEEGIVSGSPDGEEVPYSMLLLSQFRHRPALPLLLRLARHPRIDDLIGDMAREDLGRCLAACWNGSIQTLVDLARDESLEFHVRIQGTLAVVCLARAGELTREEVLRVLKDLLIEAIDRADPDMPHWRLFNFNELVPDFETKVLICDAYAKGLISPEEFRSYGFDDFLERGGPRVRNDKAYHCEYKLAIDAIQDSKWWPNWESEENSSADEGRVPMPA